MHIFCGYFKNPTIRLKGLLRTLEVRIDDSSEFKTIGGKFSGQLIKSIGLNKSIGG